MKVEVLMPKMGESITEGRILKWLKAPGDPVDRDETILEIATDKVDTEVPAPNAGILVKVMAEEGDTVEVGVPVAIIETDAGAAQVEERSPAEAKTAPEEKPAQAETPAVAAAVPAPAPSPQPAAVPQGANGSPRFYSPVVMRIASTEGLSTEELSRIPGTGAGGRVSKSDVLGYLQNRGGTAPGQAAATGGHSLAAAAAPSRSAGTGVEVVPMDNMRRIMAEHMVKSKQISPHVAVVSEVDMTSIVKFRDTHADAFKSREGFSLTFMPFIAEATIRALKDFPWVNASIEGQNILLKQMINLGIAVAMEDGGLIVPVIKNADTLNVVGLGRSITDIARRARTRKLQPEDIQDGTFTVTNFGIFGNTFGTPIINQPQVAILGIGAVQKKPVVIEVDGEDMIAIRSIMTISLSFDHRIVDGALGGRFLQRVKYYLEDFSLDSI